MPVQVKQHKMYLQKLYHHKLKHHKLKHRKLKRRRLVHMMKYQVFIEIFSKHDTLSISWSYIVRNI